MIRFLIDDYRRVNSLGKAMTLTIFVGIPLFAVIFFTWMLLSRTAQAQTTTFTGPQGQYQGSAHTFGNTTTFTGPQGQYQGQANSFGNTTTFTGPQGQFEGTMQNFGQQRQRRPW